MSESVANKRLFDEFFEYYFDLEEMIQDFEKGRMDSKRFEGDGFERHERIGHKLTALGDPGWAIYEDIDEYGEAELLQGLTEDLIEKDEEELAGNYWRQFQEVDENIRNPEENIYNRLEEAGMDESNVEYVRDEYEEHVAPLLDGTMFD